MRNLTIQRTTLIILFTLVFALATRIPVDTDTWWHIRSGEYTLTEGMIYEDPFSNTMAGVPWINHSWGSQIVLYGVWQLAGNVGLALYTTILATGGMAFIYMTCVGNVYLRAFVLIMGAATAAVFWSARPQMLSFFFSTVIFYLLYSYKRGGKDRLWFIPPIMLLWGNLHAGFSIGFIFVGGLIAGEIANNLFVRDGEYVVGWKGIRKLIIVGVVSAAALLVNPYGLNMLLVPFQTVSIGPLREFIQEWNSPNFQERQTWPFLFMVIALIGLGWGSHRKFDWSDFFMVIGTFFMSMLAGRQIAVFAVPAMVVLTYHGDEILRRMGWVIPERRNVPKMMTRLNLALIILVLLGALGYVLGTLNPKLIETTQRERLPVAVAEYLNENQPPGPMFNSYNWGGYLMFAAPEYPVFVDGRTDLYRDFLLEWLNAALGQTSWRDTLEKFGINLVVIELGSGLDRRLRDEPGWTLVYSDEMAVIYEREASS